VLESVNYDGQTGASRQEKSFRLPKQRKKERKERKRQLRFAIPRECQKIGVWVDRERDAGAETVAHEV